MRWGRGAHRRYTGGLKADLSLRWQRRKRHREIRRINIRVVSRFRPGLGVKRQPVAHGRVARNKIATLRAQEPGTAVPLSRRDVARNGQSIADNLLEAAGKYAREALAFKRIFQARVEGIDIDRQAPLAPKKIQGILVRR